MEMGLFESIVNEELSKVFRGQLNEGDKWAAIARGDVADKFSELYNQSEFDSDESEKRHRDFVKHVDRVSKMNGVNIDHSKTPRINGRTIEYSSENDPDNIGSESFEDFYARISKKLLEVGDILNKEVTKNGGMKTKTMFAHNTDIYNLGEPSDNMTDRASTLMRYRDLLDILNLSWLYDKDNRMSLATDEMKYKTIYSIVEQDGVKHIVDVIGDTLDITPTVKDIIYWCKQGSRYGKVSGKNEYREGSFGDLYGDWHKWTNSKGELKFDALKTVYEEKFVRKILSQIYGMNLDMPGNDKHGDVFAMGNAKLPSDTLIINFTSAHRCPAWNECLVKYACYARTSENSYWQLFAKNKNLNVMWEGSRYDSQLMSAMFNLIRVSCVSISSMSKILKDNLGASEDYTPEAIYETLKSEGFYGFQGESEFEVLSANRDKFVKANDIRLNEEGDFIGQWLLDAFDEFAGELKIFGINVAAYTCRHLNFDGVKNIIINASLPDIGGVDGKEANAIARRFYAVSAEEYNSFGETYASQVDGSGNPVGTPTYPTYVLDPANPSSKVGRIVPFPQPLYLDGKPTGQLYYKCPCGRGKHGKKEIKGKVGDEFDTYVVPDGVVKQSGTNAVDCYDCRMCYTPKMKGYDKPLIVLVQVHSENADKFDAAQAAARKEYNGTDFGKSADYNDRREWVTADRKEQENINAHKAANKEKKLIKKQEKVLNGGKKTKKKSSSKKKQGKKKSLKKEDIIRNILTLNESFQNGMNDGIAQVAQNGIDSVQKHMARLGKNISEQKVAFMSFFNRMLKG